MKCFSVSLAVCFAILALSFAAPSPNAANENSGHSSATPSPHENREEKAFQECNVTNPVQRNIYIVIGVGVATGQKISISQEEKCHLSCFLQKIGFLDQNYNIKGQGLTKYTLKQAPELAKYSDIIIAQIFQLARSTKGIEDKCQKAFVQYHQFAQNIGALYIADGLQSYTGIKEKIVNSIQSGQPVDQEISQQVKQYLRFLDSIINEETNEFQQKSENNAQTQVFNAQSQASGAQSQGSSHLQQQVQNAQSQVSDVQSQASSAFQNQPQNDQPQASNAQSQVSNAQAKAADAQSQGSSLLQQQAQNAQSHAADAQSRGAHPI